MRAAKKKPTGNEEPVPGADLPGAVLQTDNLGKVYTEAADNREESERSREASLLFSIAEAHLNDDDDPVEAIRIIDQAISIFRAVGDNDGLADSLRLRMHGTRKYAAQEHEDGHGGREEELLNEAKVLCREEMRVFKECSFRRGEAAMLLAIGEALCCLGRSERLTEALEDYLLEAEDIARELGDVKLQALIAYEKCTVLHMRHRYKQAGQAAKEAQKLFNSIGDPRNEGLSWCALGLAQINNGQSEDGLTKALRIYRKHGLRKQEGTCLCSLAGYLMEKDEYQHCIDAAQDAVAIFQDLGDVHWEVQADHYIIEAYIKMKDYGKAMNFAEESLKVARKSGIKKETLTAMQFVARVHMESKPIQQVQQALDTADEVKAVAMEMEDPRSIAQAFHLAGEIYYFHEAWHQAEEQALQEVQCLEGLRRYEEEAIHALNFLSRIHVQKDDYDAALATLRRAKELAIKIQDTRQEAHIMRAISGQHYGRWVSGQHDGQDELERAKTAAERSRELFHENGLPRWEAHLILVSLSLYYVEEGNVKEAVQWAKYGASITEEVGDNLMSCFLKHRVATIYLEDGQHSEAALWAREAWKLAKVAEDRRALAHVLITRVAANFPVIMEHAEEQQSKASREKVARELARYAQDALSMAVRIRDTQLEAVANLWVAKLHLSRGKAEDALKAAEDTLKLARECKDGSLEIDASIVEANALDACGQPVEAMKLLGETMVEAEYHGDLDGKNCASQLLEQISEAQGKGFQSAFAPLLRREPGRRRQHEIPTTEAYRKPDLANVRSFILMKLVGLRNGTNSPVEADQPLDEIGIDSLAMVELRVHLQNEFRVNLLPTVVYDYRTVTALARFLVDQCVERRIE